MIAWWCVAFVSAWYLAYTKHIPFTSHGYELKAVFENAATLQANSPVRIAGVNVGKVLSVKPEGDMTRGHLHRQRRRPAGPLRRQLTLRPRLFLEGNFFLDLTPGSPSAPDLSSGDTIPVTRTATAVQLDQVLTALQQDPERYNLQRLLDCYGTALTHVPTAAEDATQDPQVQGLTAAAALNDSFNYGGPRRQGHGRHLNRAPRPGPARPLEPDRRPEHVFGTLAQPRVPAQDLITNFNTFTGALADESATSRDPRAARAHARGGTAVAART